MNRRMHVWVWAVLALPAAAQQPVVEGVVNGASFDANLSPGCLISIFGSRLAGSTVQASSLPLPVSLGNTSVTVGGVPAPLYFVSPGQINAQIPFEVTGASVPLSVRTGVTGTGVTIRLSPAAPAIFTRTADGKGPALYFDPQFRLLDTVAGAEVIIVYATGLGVTNPPAVTGAGGAAAEPLNRVVNLPEAYLGDARAEVLYAGLAPGFAGVYQLNIRVPSGLATDRLFLRARGSQSNITEIGIPAGQNVANASGAIQSVYPTAESRVLLSPVPIIARFSVRFEISGSAGPFTVAAVSEAGSSVVRIDPAAGSFEAATTVPTAPARQFDFSGAGLTPVDLTTGNPFPGQIVPASRIDPAVLRAFSTLPLANAPGGEGATGLFQFSGEARPGSVFRIDEENNSAIQAFAGFLAIPYAPSIRNRVTVLKLYVDGRVVATQEVRFAVGSIPRL